MPVPTPARPVIPRRLHKDAVYDHLVEAVLDGTLRPGERLRDADCEDWLGVSRTPIRIAIAKLEHVQLVESIGGRSSFVVVPRRETSLDLLSSGCALLAAAHDSLPGGPRDHERVEIAEGLRAVADACVTGPTSPAATAAGAVADSWDDLWSVVAGLRSSGLAARHARRLGLPLRHHLRELSSSDLVRVADLASDAARHLEEGDPLDFTPGLVRSVASLCGLVDRADVVPGGRDASRPVGGSRPRAAPLADGDQRLHDLPVRRRLSDDVHDLVLRAVLDGTLAPDERLVDAELIAWLGVSRTPIRHALERLDETGLVELAPNRYTRIARPDAAQVVAARELYAGLVSWSADLASAAGGGDADALAAVRRLDAVVGRAEGRAMTLSTLSCLAPVIRRAVSAGRSRALSHELDVLEPRLAHGAVSCRFELPPGSWRSFSRAVSGAAPGADGGVGPAVAAFVRSLRSPADRALRAVGGSV